MIAMSMITVLSYWKGNKPFSTHYLSNSLLSWWRSTSDVIMNQLARLARKSGLGLMFFVGWAPSLVPASCVLVGKVATVAGLHTPIAVPRQHLLRSLTP